MLLIWLLACLTGVAAAPTYALAGVEMTLILVLFNAAVAYALDAQTLLLMFLPDVDAGKKAMGGAKQSDPEGSSLFCFGAQRRDGFRFTNYVMSESFLWSVLHLFGGEQVLPRALIWSGSKDLPLLVTWVSFTWILTFYAVASLKQSSKRALVTVQVGVMTSYFSGFTLVLLWASQGLFLLPTIIATVLTLFTVFAEMRAVQPGRAQATSTSTSLTPAAMTLLAALIVHYGSLNESHLLAVAIATGTTFFFALRHVTAFPRLAAMCAQAVDGSLLQLKLQVDSSRIPRAWLLVFLPGLGLPNSEDPPTRADLRCKTLPPSYFDCGSSGRSTAPADEGKGRPSSLYETFKFAWTVTIAGLAGRGEILSIPLLVLHSVGIDLPGLFTAVSGDWRFVTAYVVWSAVMAARTYWVYCSEIESWAEAHRDHDGQRFLCQPNTRPISERIHRLERRLGTFNAGAAAVLGMATTLLHLHDSSYTYMYFDVDDYGLAYYFLSWPIFFCWVELFAYAFHRFFHLKFIYATFHKLHHKFQPPTAFSAVAFHPVEFACYVLGGQLIFFVLPIHPSVMLGVGGYTAFYLVEDHTGIKDTPCWPWQPTTMYHDDHHRFFHCNFGQHVLWFDYIFGTLKHATGRTYGESAFGGHGVPIKSSTAPSTTAKGKKQALKAE